MENRVALIPRVMMKGAMGPKDYGLLITDRRSLFVLEKASKAALLGVLGDALLSDKKTFDYSSEDIERLALDQHNTVVPHESIQKLHLKKGFSSYTMSSGYVLLVDFTDNSGKTRSVKAFLTPTNEFLAAKKGEGMDKKTAAEEYAKSARRAFEQALGASAAGKAEWDV
jgi:hypothetical protein